jgi:Alpha/beta hydrolase family
VVGTLLDAGRVSRRTIVLVHGTWGRGFFPKRRDASLYPPNKRWWFEEGSQFRMRLDEALKAASLDWQIRAFLWSGANSVHARDCAASELSHQLTIDLQDPEAKVVIVAHSHGGNVALRALQKPQNNNRSSGAQIANCLVASGNHWRGSGWRRIASGSMFIAPTAPRRQSSSSSMAATGW